MQPPFPSITSPVARYIGIAEPARSIAFYGDVLGFEVRETADGLEAVSGAALLHLGAQTDGSVMLFFETGDVAAMRAAIQARGGNPSELEKVNWIKMQMFEIRDPDGNILWFGQSFNIPHAAHPAPMLRKGLPELPFDDVGAAVMHYRDVLGFHINYQQDDLGVMDRDEVTVLLIQRTARHTGIGSAYFYIENADQLCSELRAKGARVLGDPVSHPWGLRDFIVLDREGNQLGFGQTFE